MAEKKKKKEPQYGTPASRREKYENRIKEQVALYKPQISQLGKVALSDKPVDVEELHKRFPRYKKLINPEHSRLLNEFMKEKDFNIQMFMDELVYYQDVMGETKTSMKNYILAVRYVSFLPVYKYNKTQTFKRVFPNNPNVRKCEAWLAEDGNKREDCIDCKFVSAEASKYSNSPLVQKLIALSMMPLDYMLMGDRIKMLNVLTKEAMTAKTSRDRIAAADKFLTHTKTIETNKITMEDKTGKEIQNSLQSILEEKLAESVKMQKQMLAQGMGIDEVQKLGIEITDAEVIEDE